MSNRSDMKRIRILIKELRDVCHKYIGKNVNPDVLKAELQRICDEHYIHRRCAMWFKVHVVKVIEGRNHVSFELEPVYWEGLCLKDGEECGS